MWDLSILTHIFRSGSAVADSVCRLEKNLQITDEDCGDNHEGCLGQSVDFQTPIRVRYHPLPEETES